MQVVEKNHEGLSRSYAVTIPAAELGAALEARIAEILPTLNLRGFRPGKVPAAHVRRLYGKSLMGEVIDKTLNESSQKVLTDNQLRVAAQPDLKPVSDMDKVLAGGQDLAFDLEVELMPDFEPADVSGISLERLVYEPTDEEIDAELARLAEMNRTYEARAKGAPAQDGDQVLVDFVGSIDGTPFEGGAADDAELVLGSGQFIPGFEAQLVGAKAGSDVKVNVEFPGDYQVDRLAGKAATFAVKVKEVREPKAAEADDALGARLGLTDLAGLRTAIKSNMEREYAGASRFKLKRALLDALDERHDIPLPPRMVEAEFGAIWNQVEKDRESGEVSPEDADKDEATLRAEYGKIAERRVRLGLVLAEVGRRANVQVSDAELGDAMRSEAMRYGEQAQQIFEMMRNNPNLQSQMRAPLYEEKVVDHIIAQAKVADRPVSKEELLREDDLPAGFSASGDAAKDGKPKKAPRKAAPKAKAAAKTEASVAPASIDDAPAAEAAPAKPAPAADSKPARKKTAKPKAAPEG